MHAQKNLQKTQQAAGTEFVDALTKVSRQLRTVFNARVAAQGLNYARARTYLFCLAEKSGMTRRELAYELEMEQPTTGRLLDRMQKLDLIARLPDEQDRRVNKIVLTDQGSAQACIVDEILGELCSDIAEDDLRRAAALVAERVGGMAEERCNLVLAARQDAMTA